MDEEFKIDATLFKGEDEVETFDEFEGNNNLDSIAYGSQLAFDKGSADKVVIYFYRDEELLEMLTYRASDFDVKQVAVDIEQLKEKYAGKDEG